MTRKKRIVSNWGPGRLPSDEEISHAKWLEARGILATEKIQRFTAKVQDVFKDAYHHEEENFEHNIEGRRVLMCATSLAHHGLLGSVENMDLCNLDLSPVPTKHMASLTSCVTLLLSIDKVHNCDLVSILTSLKCEKLSINSKSLGREETWALVQAMESGVEMVTLSLGDLELDIEALAEYSGRGRCRGLRLWEDTKKKYKQELKTWARSKNWTVEERGTLLTLNAVVLT